MEIQLFLIDAFTNLPFKGNPAAICPLMHELSDDLYRKIAAEMNQGETAFITRINPSDSFTTDNVNPVVVFETKSGDLAVTRKGEGYVMDFPLNPPTKEDPKEFRDVIKAAVGNHPVQDVHLCSNTKKLAIRLSDSCDRSALTSLKVNPVALQSSERTGRVMEVIVTMKGSPDDQPGYDFYYRNFSPWYGIPEDPVTGSDLTVIGSYWSKKLGKKKMLAYQCSSRGGELEMEVRDDGRINITGQTVTVLQGTITL